MPNRKFKLIYLSHDLTKKVELTFTRAKVRALLLALAVIFLATNVVAGLLASFVLNSRENEALKQENDALRKHLNEMEVRIASVSSELGQLGETDKILRIMADLPDVDADVREVGVGGTEVFPGSEIKIPELSPTLWSLSRIEREIDLQQASFDEIHAKLTSNVEVIEHTPTLRPLDGGYISSGFGYRRDPFTKQVAPHEGVDISQERGTPVKVTASGQVIYTGHYYSYGKFIVVDHGFGYQTAYGHLHSIDVRNGQYVSKGQMIGTVGSTGRATGCHLHYEVRLNGQAVDPTDYFFEEVASLPGSSRN